MSTQSRPLPLLAALCLAVACGDRGLEEPSSPGGLPGEQPVAGAMGFVEAPGAGMDGMLRDGTALPVDGARRWPAPMYEPAERVDFDNVTLLGEAPTMDLPEPPRSGFRIVLPVREVAPGEEWEGCIALPYPEFEHRNVYHARIYTSGALHHSNLVGVQHDGRPSSYPSCPPGTGDSIQIALDSFLSNSPIDILFANSTQIDETEEIVFKPQTAYKVRTAGAEVLADAHYLNTGFEPVHSEVVYDFFTMPDEQVVHTLGAMVVHDQSFRVEAGTDKDVSNDCATQSRGHLVSIMPHAHERTVDFTVDIMGGGHIDEVFSSGVFGGESKITVFDEPIPLSDARIRQTCRMRNDLDRPIVYGTGQDEMCITFGYVTPATEAFVAYKLLPLTPCTTTRTGHLFE